MVVTKTTTYDGQYQIDTYTGSGGTTFTPPKGVSVIEYLVIGGGGGGGAYGSHGAGGGGGAGGYKWSGSYPVSYGTAYTITVGAGGSAGAGESSGIDGSDSVFNTITAEGGGGGGGGNGVNVPGNGGSGGGFGGDGVGAGGTGLPGGNDGGAGVGAGHHGGSGGGGYGYGSSGVGSEGVGHSNSGYTGGAGGQGGNANTWNHSTFVYVCAGGQGGSLNVLPYGLPFLLGSGTPASVTSYYGSGGYGGGTAAAAEAGSAGVVVIRYLSVTAIKIGDVSLEVGGNEYGFKPNTLYIENKIGERGLASFQCTQDYSYAKSNTGEWASDHINCFGTTPDIGTRIYFTGYVPNTIYISTPYYVISKSISAFKISTTLNGAAITWTVSGYPSATWDEYNPFTFSIGESIDIYVGGDKVWSGIIERLNKRLPGGSTKILYDVKGVSWNYACDKRRVVATYSTDVTAGLCAGSIVEDLVHNYLSIEGITTGVISTGAALSNVAFNYMQPSRCLDQLAEQSGYIWQINPDKTLDFKPHDYATLTFNVGSTIMNINNITYVESNPKYRNVQYITGGYGLTSTKTEVQYGDSTKQTFVMPYELMKVPEVYTIRGSPATSSTQSIGILGVGSSEAWFWNKFSNTLTQNATDTPLSASEKLKVEYIGGYRTVSIARKDSAIATRRSVETGSGIVEDAISKGRDSYATENDVLATELTSKYSVMTNTLQFRTIWQGITPGNILKIDFPEFGLSSEEMLVDSVTIRDEDAAVMWYNVSCLTGPEHGGWSKFFDDILTRTIERDINADTFGDSVLISTDFSNTHTWAETIVKSTFKCVLPGTTVYPETSNYPC